MTAAEPTAAEPQELPLESTPAPPPKKQPRMYPRSLTKAEKRASNSRDRLEAAEVVLERARESHEHAKSEAAAAIAAGRKYNASVVHMSRDWLSTAEHEVEILQLAVKKADEKVELARAQSPNPEEVDQLDLSLDAACKEFLDAFEAHAAAERAFRETLFKTVGELGALPGLVELGTHLAVSEAATSKINRVIGSGCFVESRWRFMG